MSIFWIGGPEGIIVPDEDINFIPDEDRYFLPGIIHGGENYLIQVCYWSIGKGPENDRIGAKYLYADSILEWAKEASSDNGILNRDIFEELINENAEDFTVLNDGTGDFYSLNEAWDKSVSWDYEEVVNWAKNHLNK